MSRSRYDNNADTFRGYRSPNTEGKKEVMNERGRAQRGMTHPLNSLLPPFLPRVRERGYLYAHKCIHIYIFSGCISLTRARAKHVRDTQRRGYTSHHLFDSLILAARSSSPAERQLPKAFVKVRQEERVTARVVPDPA